jgi:hypothetical protein
MPRFFIEPTARSLQQGVSSHYRRYADDQILPAVEDSISYQPSAKNKKLIADG